MEIDLASVGLSKHNLSNHQPIEGFGFNCGKFVIPVATLINAVAHPRESEGVR